MNEQARCAEGDQVFFVGTGGAASLSLAAARGAFPEVSLTRSHPPDPFFCHESVAPASDIRDTRCADCDVRIGGPDCEDTLCDECKPPPSDRDKRDTKGDQDFDAKRGN